MYLRYVAPQLCGILLALSSTAHGQEAATTASKPERYVLKHEEIRAGTNIRPDLAITDYPLDKPYSALTPAQAARLKSNYKDMPAADEPPYPLKGPKNLIRAIVKAAGMLDAWGEVEAIVVVDSEGKGHSVSVLKSPDPRLTQFIAQALMLEKYKPAVCAGKACAMQYPFWSTIVQVH